MHDAQLQPWTGSDDRHRCRCRCRSMQNAHEPSDLCHCEGNVAGGSGRRSSGPRTDRGCTCSSRSGSVCPRRGQHGDCGADQGVGQLARRGRGHGRGGRRGGGEGTAADHDSLRAGLRPVTAPSLGSSARTVLTPLAAHARGPLLQSSWCLCVRVGRGVDGTRTVGGGGVRGERGPRQALVSSSPDARGPSLFRKAFRRSGTDGRRVGWGHEIACLSAGVQGQVA